jgi:mannosyltransferase
MRSVILAGVNAGQTAALRPGLEGEGKGMRSLLARARPRALTPTLLVALLTVAGAAMRFGTLDVQSIWLDEATTMVLVRHSLTGMFSHLYYEETPPLYFLIAWIWTKIFGTGVLGFRSLSALCGTITIPVMYAVGRRVSPRVGLWAAALTTVSPVMYYYSQEARCYALLILFSAVALLFWIRVLQEGDGRSLLLWTVTSILALLTHYFAIYMFIPEAALLLRRLGWRRMLAPIGAEALTGIALLPLALWQNSTYGDVLESTSTVSRAAETVKQLLVGLYGPLEIDTALLTGLLAVIALILLWKRGEKSAHRLALAIGCVGVVALLLPFLLALVHVEAYSFEGRHLISVWVPLALVVSMGLGVHGSRMPGALLGSSLCVVSLAVIVATNAIPGYQREDWRGVAGTLASDLPSAASTSPSVIVTQSEALEPLRVYLPILQRTLAARLDSRELEFVALRKKRTGRSPLPPVVPTTAPSGYRLVAVKRTEAYAVSRFLARSPEASLEAKALRADAGQAEAEVLLLR